MNAVLKAENITVRYGDHTIVDGLSFHLQEGQWLMLAGPNGAGKSSLIAAIAQAVPYTGTVLLEGRNVRAFKPAMLARKIVAADILPGQHVVVDAGDDGLIVRG